MTLNHNLPGSLQPFAQKLQAVRKAESAPISSLAASLVPETKEAAYAVQNFVASSMGPVKGWKVGASDALAEPSAAPLHGETLFSDGAVIAADFFRHRGVEVEFAYRFDRAVGADITRETVLAAVGSVHPAIEIVDTRFAQPASQAPLAHMADQQSHGALILGPAFTDWTAFDPSHEHFVMRVDHRRVSEQVGGNAAGDLSRLLVWLAGHAAARGMPIEAGTVVTTGSLSGAFFVPHRTHVNVRFYTLGEVSVFLA
ncbi:2-keto-4-pentenoate hydratase [Acetobacter conturbans]|uniref:2-keto-4-pentenoate hydratase n=1 Tax=Acetobacter conturbans TaxID=1737472 RepID=A0ABX0JYQ6_9PROT|nr:fumarylacetoacetate hydrolase family protein [Acetobacter conturbans]NHN87183.1 2-keto-4-pentenoate hydratase [Acetobacter conturbans]